MEHKIHVSAIGCKFLGYNNKEQEYYCKITGNYLADSTWCMRCKFSELRVKENIIRSMAKRKEKDNGRLLRLA